MPDLPVRHIYVAKPFLYTNLLAPRLSLHLPLISIFGLVVWHAQVCAQAYRKGVNFCLVLHLLLRSLNLSAILFAFYAYTPLKNKKRMIKK